jgi:transposase-like protein
VRIVEEISLVARRHGIAGNQLFTSRRLIGRLTAAGAGEQVVPASELRARSRICRIPFDSSSATTAEQREAVDINGLESTPGYMR